MHDPDRSVRRRNANRNGHGGKRIAPPPVIDRWESLQPLGIGRRSSPATRLEPAQGGAIMITQHDRLKAPLKPLERLGRVRASIDEIADAEEAVAFRVEVQSVESTLKGAEAPVDVTDHEVPTVDIGRKDPVIDRRPVRSGNGNGFEVRVRPSGNRKASPVLHHTSASVVEVCTPIIPRHPGANRMGERYLGNVEIDAGLRSPDGERGPETVRIRGDLQLREQLRKCIVVEHSAPHGEEDEIGIRASASNARQVGVIARLAQDHESRRRKRDGVCFALLHSQGRHAPCGLREIDLRPSGAADLVRAHGREDEKLEKQSRANPGIRRAHGRQSRRNLGVRQSTVVLDLCRNVGRHGIERRTTRIVLPIPLANSPSRHGSDLLANFRHRRRGPRSNRLQDSGHMVRFDIAYTESAQLGINIEFKRPSPALLGLLTSPVGPPQPNDVFHGLGKGRNNAVPMRTLVYEGVNPVINKLAVA